jgi:phospholipase C
MTHAPERATHTEYLVGGHSYEMPFGPPSEGNVVINAAPDPSFNTKTLRIEVHDGSGRSLGSAFDSVTVQVPTHTHPTPPTPPALPGPPWRVRVTNTGSHGAAITTTVDFTSFRPVIDQPVSLGMLNKKLDEIWNDVQPLTIGFVNQQVGWRLWDKQHQHWVGDVVSQKTPIHDSNLEWRPIIHSFVTFDLNADWERVYGVKVKNIDLGARALESGSLVTTSLQLRAVVMESRFALRLRVNFVSRDAVLLLPFPKPNVKLKDGAVEVDLLLAGADDHTPRFTPVGIAHAAGSMIVIGEEATGWALRGAIEYKLEETLSRLRVDFGAHKNVLLLEAIAGVVMTWLVGDRGRKLVGQSSALTLHYAGDLPTGPTTDPGTHVPADPIDPGRLRNITHIVVMMMENRSFDHMLGYLKLAGREDIDGISLTMSNRASPISNERAHVFEFAEGQTRFPYDPGHDFTATRNQRGDIDLPGGIHLGQNDGFILDFARRLRDSYHADPLEIMREKNHIMGFHGARNVPTFDALAREFAICNRWFSAHPGHTWPNRFISLTGLLAPGPDGQPQIDNPDPAYDFDPLEVPTIFDHLDAAGVDWRYYEHDVSFLRLFSRHTWDTQRILPVDDPERGFFAAARAGKLSPVTYIEPNITDLPSGDDNDDHPPSDIHNGQQLIGRVYNALRDSPHWPSTLFIVTYDEAGGFFDHVFPADGEAAPLCNDPQGRPVTHYGLRVPALVISPWVERAAVTQTFDHTTILKTIIQCFMYARPPGMGPRVAAARSLEQVLTLATARLDRARVNVLPARARSLVVPPRPPVGGDFHAFMTKFKARVAAGLAQRRGHS